MASSTVTLDKAYFETLMRRAQFHISGADFATPINVETVTIPKTDHDTLLDSARAYANLRRNLYQGGITEETFALLIRDETPSTQINGATVHSGLEELSDGGVLLNPLPQSTISGTRQDYTFGRNASYTVQNNNVRSRNSNGLIEYPNTGDDPSLVQGTPDGFCDGVNGVNESQIRSLRQQYDKFCKRTILLSNLPEGTTHADITQIVRGGLLLDIYLRKHERTAAISFLEEAAAQEYFRHVKRHDLYIRCKRIEIRWDDRQFILPNHVAHKIAIGATRNLVIHNRTAKHTEDAIREDLEHIHNLAVIKIAFREQSAHISTNSVHNAMFARTCMMSRAVYKGSKIGWDIDECAAPIERPPQVLRENIKPRKEDASNLNRFQLLYIDKDGSVGGSLDDDHLDTSGLTFNSGYTNTSTGVVA